MPHLPRSDTKGLVGGINDMPAMISHIARRALEDIYDFALKSAIEKRDVKPDDVRIPGSASPKVFPPGMLALFCVLFSSLAVIAVWFFMWAKNGGFIFKKNDWDDYVSSVLRRKDKDGNTISGDTMSTSLGHGTIQGDIETGHAPTIVSSDHENGLLDDLDLNGDMASYRQERPARVGGLNRKPDGSYVTDGTPLGGTDSRPGTARPGTGTSRPGSPKKGDPNWRAHLAQLKEVGFNTKETGEKFGMAGVNAGAKLARFGVGIKNGIQGFFQGYFEAAYPKSMKAASMKDADLPWYKRRKIVKVATTRYTGTVSGDRTITDASSYISHPYSDSQTLRPKTGEGSRPQSKHYSKAPPSYTDTYTGTYTDSYESASRPSFEEGDDGTYYTHSQTHSRTHSSYTASRVSASNVVEEDSDEDENVQAQGTKAYRHVIPGLSQAGSSAPARSLVRPVFEEDDYSEVSQSTEGRRRQQMQGYRRTGGNSRRRDSLSDSDG